MTFLTPDEKSKLRKHLAEGSGALPYEVACLLDEIDAWDSKTDELYDCIAELEAKVAAQDTTIRSWSGPVAGYAEDPARQLAIAQQRIDALTKERDEARALANGMRNAWSVAIDYHCPETLAYDEARRRWARKETT